jgi:hypothetical protein
MGRLALLKEEGGVRVCSENWRFGFELLTSILSPCPRERQKITEPGSFEIGHVSYTIAQAWSSQ